MCREGAVGYRWLVEQDLREEKSSPGIERLLLLLFFLIIFWQCWVFVAARGLSLIVVSRS